MAYVPAFRLLWSSMDTKVGHLRRYTRRSLARAVGGAGFDVRACRYADSAGFAATLLFKAFGNTTGAIDRRALRAFDRFAFPAGRALDRAGASWLFGKNVYCVADRAG